MKPRLAFIDHSFHKKTQATAFLMDILSENFDIECIWDDSWSGGDSISIEYLNKHNFEFVLFFQVLFPVDELKKLRGKLIWVPMYDGVVGRAPSFWMELSQLPIKVISFSKRVFDVARSFGIQSVSVQYFFDPEKFKEISQIEGKRIFFWQRTKFSFKDVKKILGNQRVEKFVLKLDVDPGYTPVRPTNEDMRRYNIEIIDGNLSKEDYLELVRGSNIFIAPRKFEGIGMSFIEAMTMGLAVVAFDHPTMNEYMVHQKSGYLVNERRLGEIDFSKFQEIGEKAREVCKKGYKEWLMKREKLADFIVEDFRPPRRLNILVFSYVKSVRFLYRCLRRIGFYYEWL